jgi:alpha-tubulin suppressor-like RCC1 family protein
VGALAGVTKIAAGTYNSLALKSDGTLWAWGYQTMGQTADGRTRGLESPDWSTPVKLSGLAGVASMAGTLAVTIDGAIWDWGGAGGAAPARVSGLSGVVSVTGGTSLTRDFSADLSSYSETYCHMAVLEDGTVWEWGIQYPRSNGWRMDPVPVGPTPIAGLADVRMAAASEVQNVVLKRDGTVWEWGIRGPSPPWSGYPEPRPSPVPVSGLTDVASVAVFNYRSLALKRDGTVWAWGNSNYFGELGDGTTTNRMTPVQVAGLSDVVAIDTRPDGLFVGVPHSVALKRDGTVWEWPVWEFEPAWAAKSLAPVQVSGLTDIVAVAEGGGHSLALKRDGTVWAWGQNMNGQLGVRTFAIRTTPVQVVAPAAP